MGGGKWDSTAYVAHASSYAGKSVEQITSSYLNPNLDPKNIPLRESRDSDDNPESTPIIICNDLTGSMGFVVNYIMKQGLNDLCTGIYDKSPVPNPHILCMGVGDLKWDHAPLQVTQFEADIRILEQLELMWLEKGGGGNSWESYTLPWLFAAKRIVSDCWDKRGKKGYIFTVGDERPNPTLEHQQVTRALGSGVITKDITSEDLLKEVSEKYNVFHVIAEEGSNGRDRIVHEEWKDLLGQRVITMSDHKKIAELVISAIQICEGVDPEDVANSWDAATAKTIKSSIKFRG